MTGPVPMGHPPERGLQGYSPKRAGITGLSFHRLRHTVASRLIERNADIEEVRSIRGHSGNAVTQRCVHKTIG